MYPLKSKELAKTLTQAERELGLIRDALRTAILAIEVERTQIADINQGFDENLNGILGLGVLLNDLQIRRTRAQQIAAGLPSPNKVDAAKAARVVALGKLAFETVEHARNIQSEIYRLARLNLRAASHKINFAESVRKNAAKVRSTSAA